MCPKNIELFTRHRVYTETELKARYEIKLSSYCKVLHIEALTMLDMTQKDILPAVSGYARSLAEAALAKRSLSDTMDVSFETGLATKISRLTAELNGRAAALSTAVTKAEAMADSLERACFYRDAVLEEMGSLRQVADELETLCSAEYWPYPSYGDLLFSVK